MLIRSIAILTMSLALMAQGPELPIGGVGSSEGGGSTEANAFTPADVTTPAAPTLTCPASKLTNGFSLTLTVNVVIAAPINCPVGFLEIEITNSASFTCDFNAIFINLPDVPCDTGVNHRSHLTFFNNGTNYIFKGGSYPDASGHRYYWVDGQVTQFDTYCVDTDNTDDAHTCNWWGPVDFYKIGQTYGLCVAFTNVGPATVNFASVGVVSIKKLTAAGLVDLADGDMVAGSCYAMVYTPTSVMQLVSPIANVATSVPTVLYTKVNDTPVQCTGSTAFDIESYVAPAGTFAIGDRVNVVASYAKTGGTSQNPIVLLAFGTTPIAPVCCIGTMGGATITGGLNLDIFFTAASTQRVNGTIMAGTTASAAGGIADAGTVTTTGSIDFRLRGVCSPGETTESVVLLGYQIVRYRL